MRCQRLERGCIHDVLLRVGRRKTVLVISCSCSAHFFKRRRPLLLHFPIPSVPPHSFSVSLVCAYSSIEVSQEDAFVFLGCRRNYRIQIIIELVFNLIWVGHCGYICLFPDKGSLSVIKRSFMHYGSPESLLTRCGIDGETYSCFRPFFFLASTPEKSVANTNFF